MIKRLRTYLRLTQPNHKQRLGDEGIIALEFAAIIGFFAIATLTMVDISFAISDRMRMNRMIATATNILSIESANVTDMRNILESMFNDGTPEVSSYTVAARDYCQCGEVVYPICPPLCPDGLSTPAHYIEVTVSHTHNGYFLGTLPVEVVTEMQTR